VCEVRLVTILAGVELEHPLMNGPGTCKTVEDVRRFARSSVSAVNVGSITVLDRPSNPGNTYWSGVHYALNSRGLPNPGHAYYAQNLPEMADLCHANGKGFTLSVAGFRPEEYGVLAKVGFQGGADYIELNLGCPNVWAEGQQKRIASFDPSGIVSILRAVERRVPVNKARIGIKLSPYSDPGMLEEVADTIAQLPVNYIATCNTFPNSYEIDDSGKPVIGAGYAGLSGEAMKPVGQGQVRQFRERLNGGVQIIGMSGILTGRDMADYLQPDVGADAVAATTAYWRSHEDVGVYGDILAAYVEQVRTEH